MADGVDTDIHQPRWPKHPHTQTAQLPSISGNSMTCEEFQRANFQNVEHSKSESSNKHLPEQSPYFQEIRAQIQEFITKQEKLDLELRMHIPAIKSTELKNCLDLVDRFGKTLDPKVGEVFKNIVKEKFQKRAESIWAAHPNIYLIEQAEKEIERAQNTRAALENEILKLESAVQNTAEASRHSHIDELAEELSKFTQHEVPLPSASDFDLHGLRCSLLYALSGFEDSDLKDFDQLFHAIDRLHALTISETYVIEKERLKLVNDHYAPCISGLVKVDDNLFMAVDGFNNDIKLLDTNFGVVNQLFSRAADVEMAGLFEPPIGSAAHLLVCVEFEASNDPEADETSDLTRLVVLLRTPSGGVILLNTLPFPEHMQWLYPTFAILPNGNVLCGVPGFTRVYELKASTSNNESGAFTLIAHQLPMIYCCICGFHVGNEWRLAVSFDDDSVRSFAFRDGIFSEVASLPPLPEGHRPTRILHLRTGVLCINSAKQKADDSWESFLDIVTYESSGHFFQPLSLLQFDGTLMPLSTYLVSAADTSKVGLVALDWETKCLHFYEINT